MLNFSRWKIITIIAISVIGLIYAAPNLFSEKSLENVPNWLPHKQVHLGLDLQGGSHLLLEMNKNELIAEWLETIRDDARNALRRDRIGYTGLRPTQDGVVLRIRKPEDQAKAITTLRTIIQPLQGSVFTGTGGDDLEISEAGQGSISIKPTNPALTERINSAIGSTIETIRRRVDELGTTEPNIQRQGQARILVQVPGFDDPQKLKELVGKTAKLTFQLVEPSMTAAQAKATRSPPGTEIYPASDEEGIEYLLKKRAIVSGEDLVDAQPSFDQRSNEPVVTFRFNSSGARRFGKVTRDNVGRPFAIVLDREVISAPVIQEPILGGTGQISGNFSVEEANNLSILLRSGALPASLDIIEERTVGPSLGADSIAAGKVAAVLGLVGVIVFVLFAYGHFGIFAITALLINIALIIGTLSLLQATLTLPGIAGIVLTIGMAVDANVLIFERIREELRAGKSAINAISSGYSRALGTILDANITTFIAAFILFWLGSGPIRGFAVTLSIGILTSVFTAFTVTRFMVSLWLRSKKTREIVVPI
ncbi:MAG: protein translocase subunit SecD [Methyloligellaceae bacterium]